MSRLMAAAALCMAIAAANTASAADKLVLQLHGAAQFEFAGYYAALWQGYYTDAGHAVAALADKSVDAVIGSIWDVPFLARDKGLQLKSFNPGDYRVEFYGDTLFTLQRRARAEPQLVRSFRAASLKGWDYALQHPDEIAAKLVGELPAPPGIADAAGFAR